MQVSSILSGDARRQGIIYKATAGFYYVQLPDAVHGDREIECRARGIFRKDGQKPYVGDHVLIQMNDDGSGTVDELLPRKNALIRPPLANLDYMVVVLSVTDPAPNLQVVDKFLAILEYKDIEPLIAITKSDLEAPDSLAALYRGAGFSVFVVDHFTGEGVDALIHRLTGKFSAFSGNSGVGKSTLLNVMAPNLDLEVGVTSKKLGRGRHTTRTVETHLLPGGGLVADTPGFTSLEMLQMSDITAQELAYSFREFAPFLGACKFQDCTHTCEKGCAVLSAAADGYIAASRHQSYCALYGELKDVKQWQRR